MTTITEIIARALCEVQIRDARRWDTDPERLEEMMAAAVDYSWADNVPDATAAITALEAQGYVIVPFAPTAAMIASVDDEDSDKYLARGRAVSAWAAMIQAGREAG